MKTKFFHYNPDTYTYEPAEVGVEQRLRLALRSMALAFVGALLVVVYGMATDVHVEDRFVAEHTHRLLTKLNGQGQQMSDLQVSLHQIHQNDNTFYRSILNLEPIDKTVWEGGTGGTDKYRELFSERQKQIAILRDQLVHQVALQQNSFATLEELAEQKSLELKHIPAIRPIEGRLSGGFGYRNDPFTGERQYHPGLDFNAITGTPIYASGKGLVVRSGVSESGYGIQVELNHGFGYQTKYAHMSRTAVAIGDSVERGQLIGYVGSTGYSVGPHLHYEVIRNGVKVNPIDYFYNN